MEGLKPSKTWDVSAFDRVNNEWTTTQNHSYDHEKPASVELVAVREVVLDTRRPRRKAFKELLVFSDVHVGYRSIQGELDPLHDEQAMARMANLAEDLRPDYVINLGDTNDNATISRFAPDSTHFNGTMQPSLQRAHDFLADMAERTPGAERHMLEGNHDKRLGDFVLKHAMPLADIRIDKYPAFSYPGILKLEDIGWQYHGGYPASEFQYKEDLAFIHGTIATKTGTAQKLGQDNYDRNIVQGHKHSIETAYHTDRRGRQLGAFVVGTLCRIDGVVPSHANGVDQYGEPVRRFDNHQRGAMVIRDYGDGKYEFNQIPIHDDGLFFNGKRY